MQLVVVHCLLTAARQLQSSTLRIPNTHHNLPHNIGMSARNLSIVKVKSKQINLYTWRIEIEKSPMRCRLAKQKCQAFSRT